MNKTINDFLIDCHFTIVFVGLNAYSLIYYVKYFFVDFLFQIISNISPQHGYSFQDTKQDRKLWYKGLWRVHPQSGGSCFQKDCKNRMCICISWHIPWCSRHSSYCIQLYSNPNLQHILYIDEHSICEQLSLLKNLDTIYAYFFPCISIDKLYFLYVLRFCINKMSTNMIFCKKYINCFAFFPKIKQH